jgi:hypothetical protein
MDPVLHIGFRKGFRVCVERLLGSCGRNVQLAGEHHAEQRSSGCNGRSTGGGHTAGSSDTAGTRGWASNFQNVSKLPPGNLR